MKRVRELSVAVRLSEKDLELFSISHNLKIYPEFFAPIESGVKNFEIRKNDRNYKVDDLVLLREYFPGTKQYTGRVIMAKITYITDYGQKDGYVVFGIKTVSLVN